jgi:flagellar protein FliO/FliZ
MRVRFLIAGILPAFPVLAEAERPAFKPVASVDTVQWLGGLMVVLAAILLFAWALRRLGSFSASDGGRFKVLAALSVGARERVVLVQAGDKQLVLGVAPGRVQTLCILEAEQAIRIGVSGSSAPGDAFAARLAALLPGRRP